MNNSEALSDLRKQIDELDYKIHDLLNERAKCALEVARVKVNEGSPVVQFHRPDREAQIMAQVAAYNKGPLSSEAVTKIFKTIIAACLDLQIGAYPNINR